MQGSKVCLLPIKNSIKQGLKKLFNLLNKLLHKNQTVSLPDYNDPACLADDFVSDFSNKVKAITDTFQHDQNQSMPSLEKEVVI